MAIGKATTADEVDQAQVIIRFGNQEVYPSKVDEAGLEALAAYMRGDEVRITAVLAAGRSTATVWGCDLTDGYVRINADYTT
jgi:glutamate N-acetyltransferase/amino-acid N-acetyltransferase